MKKKKTTVSTMAIDSEELIEALDALEKERGIKKEDLLKAIETALVIAYKKNFGTEENVKITMNGETGEIHVYSLKDVVEVVENPNEQIMLEDAKKISPKLAIGDKAEIELIPKNFGRIAAQTAKQTIIQSIREGARSAIFDEFNERKGEIVSGIVKKADEHMVVLDLGKLEAVMPEKQMVPGEVYTKNSKIRAYVLHVGKGQKGSTQVTVSRSCSDFVRKLFELEIPEIYEGVIEIKGVSRDAGSRSKVAIYSPNENIDPVGSCVGQKGIRIQNIINELHGEKIDVIEWNEDPAIFISSALLPAQVMAVDVREEDGEKTAQVIVPNDQLSLAIGKAGQNVRLAANLTGYKTIDIKSEAQFRKMLEEAQNKIDGKETATEQADEAIEVEESKEVVEENKEEASETPKKKKTTAKKASKKKEEAEKDDKETVKMQEETESQEATEEQEKNENQEKTKLPEEMTQISDEEEAALAEQFKKMTKTKKKKSE